MWTHTPQLAALLLALCALTWGCGDDPGPAASAEDMGQQGDLAPDQGEQDLPQDLVMDAPGDEPDMADPYEPPLLEDGVVLTAVAIPGFEAPPNPVTGAQTPPEASMARFVRYTLGEPGPLAERQGVLILVPGFLAGAGSFDTLARQVVTRTEGRFEVWAIDRRSNGLEDQRGMLAAEQARDPSLAQGYYFEGQALEGEVFAGLRPAEALSFMSEWGLEVHLGDLRAVLSLVPAQARERHLFLAGHSLGASLVQSYSCTRFEDGHEGHDDIAGLILYDGAVGLGVGDEPISEQELLEGFDAGLLGMRAPGLNALREQGGAVVASLPFVAPEVFLTVEIAGMRASRYLSDPQGVTADRNVDDFFGLSMQAKPRATHEAVLGFAFDQQYQPFVILNNNMGSATGGPQTAYDSFLTPGVTLLRPDDRDALYSWQAWDAVDPPEVTNLQDFALSLYAGPSNFVEWYFPTRLQVDLAAVGPLSPIPDGDWRLGYGLRTQATASMDAPVFAIGGEEGLITDTARWDGWRDKIAQTTRRGDTRQQPAAYTTIIAPGQAHLDVVSASNQGDQDHTLAPLLEWMQEIAGEGRVQISAP